MISDKGLKKSVNSGACRGEGFGYLFPTVVYYSIAVEAGYSATSNFVVIENLGETKEEGEW